MPGSLAFLDTYGAYWSLKKIALQYNLSWYSFWVLITNIFKQIDDI